MTAVPPARSHLTVGPGEVMALLGPSDADAAALTGLMDGVDVFTPDRQDIEENQASYVEAWRSAAGS